MSFWPREDLERFYAWLWPKFQWQILMAGAVGLGLLGIWAYLQFTVPAGSSSSGYRRKVIAVEEDRETVSRVFARAAYFKVVEDSRVIDVVKNPYVEALPAGPPAARLVAGYRPEVVVTGSIGPLARKELEDRGIRIEIR